LLLSPSPEKQLLMRSGAMYQQGLDTGVFCDRNVVNLGVQAQTMAAAAIDAGLTPEAIARSGPALPDS
jgi:hypothetical protein